MATKLREKHDGGALGGLLEVRLWLRLLSCSTIIEKRIRRRFTDQFGTTLPRFDVLAALDRKPEGLRMSELSRALLVSNGNVTALVKQLESEGYITSKTAEDDRRSSVVAITSVGEAYFKELSTAHHAWIKAMFGGMPKPAKQNLYKLLDTLKHSLDDEA